MLLNGQDFAHAALRSHVVRPPFGSHHPPWLCPASLAAELFPSGLDIDQGHRGSSR